MPRPLVLCPGTGDAHATHCVQRRGRIDAVRLAFQADFPDILITFPISVGINLIIWFWCVDVLLKRFLASYSYRDLPNA
ncbi:hypothetical protein BD310DRAFT_931508 [Dichomitus squalens]|uniref:Uncharacterized protein n=1 Tax=Dichomitus squalens TaxID=114155 RepID=A0A4Q9PPT3_9APHY|nr:hypothetical protein BD310DRAFT_931508 [Dichomitus squalens]